MAAQGSTFVAQAAAQASVPESIMNVYGWLAIAAIATAVFVALVDTTRSALLRRLHMRVRLAGRILTYLASEGPAFVAVCAFIVFLAISAVFVSGPSSKIERATRFDGLAKTSVPTTAWAGLTVMLEEANATTCSPGGDRHSYRVEGDSYRILGQFMSRLLESHLVFDVIAESGDDGTEPAHITPREQSNDWVLFRILPKQTGRTYLGVWYGQDPHHVIICEGPSINPRYSAIGSSEARTQCMNAITAQLLVPQGRRFHLNSFPEWSETTMQWRWAESIDTLNAFGVRVTSSWRCIIPEGLPARVELIR